MSSCCQYGDRLIDVVANRIPGRFDGGVEKSSSSRDRRNATAIARLSDTLRRSSRSRVPHLASEHLHLGRSVNRNAGHQGVSFCLQSLHHNASEMRERTTRTFFRLVLVSHTLTYCPLPRHTMLSRRCFLALYFFFGFVA